jgi:hypothetical protein
VNNPYQDSLAGLEIADPVRAFFDWCIEREAIRIRRLEIGQMRFSEIRSRSCFTLRGAVRQYLKHYRTQLPIDRVRIDRWS